MANWWNTVRLARTYWGIPSEFWEIVVQYGTQGFWLKILSSHYFSIPVGNIGVKRSEILQGTQIFGFGPLLFILDWKTLEKPKKYTKMNTFLTVFQSLFNFGWKVADQTNKFEFLDVFCFFWYPCWLQKWRNSGDIAVFLLFIDVFWWCCHLAIFFIIFKIKPNVSFITSSIVRGLFL